VSDVKKDYWLDDSLDEQKCCFDCLYKLLQSQFVDACIVKGKLKTHALSHTWIGEGDFDRDNRKILFLTETLHIPEENVLIDYRDFDQDKDKKFKIPEELKEAMDKCFCTKQVIVLPTHDHYLKRTWCITELLLTMISGIDPLVPISFQFPDSSDFIPASVYEVCDPKLHKLITLLGLFATSKFTDEKDLNVITSLLVGMITKMTPERLALATKWNVRKELDWSWESYPPLNDSNNKPLDLLKFNIWLLEAMSKMKQAFESSNNDKPYFKKCQRCGKDIWVDESVLDQKWCFDCVYKLLIPPKYVLMADALNLDLERAIDFLRSLQL